jgi:hypothetical protein
MSCPSHRPFPFTSGSTASLVARPNSVRGSECEPSSELDTPAYSDGDEKQDGRLSSEDARDASMEFRPAASETQGESVVTSDSNLDSGDENLSAVRVESENGKGARTRARSSRLSSANIGDEACGRSTQRASKASHYRSDADQGPEDVAVSWPPIREGDDGRENAANDEATLNGAGNGIMNLVLT